MGLRPPPSELAGKAQSTQVGEMAGAETPGFDAAGFKTKLMARIEELATENFVNAQTNPAWVNPALTMSLPETY